MKRACLLSIVAILSGCASLSHGPKQRVMVSTPGAPGAECDLTSPSVGVRHFRTPEAIELPRSPETVQIRCQKKCFYNETKAFNPVINGEDLASNGFFGGATLPIDLATQRAYNYQYEFTLNMRPNHSCRKGGKGFLDGDPKDFDNQIKDFSFDDEQKYIPEPQDGSQSKISSSVTSQTKNATETKAQ